MVARLASAGVQPDARWLLLHPGASAPSRRYPPEQFAAAARLLVERTGCRVVLSGDERERALVHEIVGKTQLGGLGQPPRWG